jgi:hypothetical protein
MDKYNLSDIFSNLDTQSSVILPKSTKIKNIKLSNTTSSFMPQESGYSDATSSFMPQKGGYLNNNKNKDITQLLSMLSATSHDNYTTNSTDNAKQLNKLLNKVQYGGTKEELTQIYTRLKNIVITLYVKSIEEWKRLSVINIEPANLDTFITLQDLIDKIISIFNTLTEDDKGSFINFLYSEIIQNNDILIQHPILFLIYNHIFNIETDNSNNMNYIIKTRIILYKEIQKIFGNYLTISFEELDKEDPFKIKVLLDTNNPLFYQIEDTDEKFKFLFFLQMLQNMRNNIEDKLMV